MVLNSNSCRKVDCPETLHGCPQSFQTNAPTVPFTYTFFLISYFLIALTLDVSLNKDVWRSVNIAPRSTSQLQAQSTLQPWKEPLIFMVQETGRDPHPTWTRKMQPPCPIGDLTIVVRPQSKVMAQATRMLICELILKLTAGMGRDK